MPQELGMRGTASYGAGGTLERKYDVSDKVFLLDPGTNPLLTLLTNIGKVADGVTWKGSSLKKKVTIDPEFKEFEDAYGASRTQLNGAIAGAGTTAFVVDEASYFADGDVLLVVDAVTKGMEQVYVQTVTVGTNTLTVVRAQGTANLGAIADNSWVYRIGSANDEGQTYRSANTTRKTLQTNYTQIFRTPFALTNTEAATEMYTGDELKFQTTKKGIEHALDIERACWFGNKAEVTGLTGQVKRYTGGIFERIDELGSAYIQDEGGTSLTESEFITFLKKGFQHGRSNKYLFCSGTVLQAINNFSAGALRITPKDTTYGVQLSTYLSPWGTVNLVYNPLFVQDFDGYAVMIDFDTITYRFLGGNSKNRDTKLYMDRQNPGVDGVINEYITECGLERTGFERNAYLKGVTS
jgi:hypothetical protein